MASSPRKVHRSGWARFRWIAGAALLGIVGAVYFLARPGNRGAAQE